MPHPFPVLSLHTSAADAMSYSLRCISSQSRYPCTFDRETDTSSCYARLLPFPDICTPLVLHTSGNVRSVLPLVLLPISGTVIHRILRLSICRAILLRTYCRRYLPSIRVFCSTRNALLRNRAVLPCQGSSSPEAPVYGPSCPLRPAVVSRISDSLPAFWLLW